ncbi:MAG: alpha-N-acetylglucosaminidase [Clostridiales bacterium]|nr:alpha-N-acetylglucosaminidase [Clostridiales bacterium]
MQLLSYEILNASGEADKNSIPLFSAVTYPCFIDLTFSEVKSVFDVIPVFPDNCNPEYEIFRSLDGVNFYKFQKGGQIANYIRVFVKYVSSDTVSINNIEVVGEDCLFPQKHAPFNEICKFEDSPYCAEINDEDILEEVRGIIARAIGENYVDGFELKLDRRIKSDYYTIESLRGKVRLISNSGVGLASAFNAYLKKVCNCHISRFGKQVSIPHNLPAVPEKIDCQTKFEHRYAYNYCAHSYSMSFWDEEDWQKEIDFLAMNGVNMVLDITGMEEVYRRFLSKIGYRHREIKNFLTGPSYFAWSYMANITGVGGPLHDAFFAEKCELARKNHRRMQILGMNVVLQMYNGMVPANIKKKNRDIPVIEQGLWNGLPRPLIIDPSSASYIKYAELYYQSQKEVFGDITRYFAGDICHEGGSLEGSNEKEVYGNFFDSIIRFRNDAVVIMQGWGENPTKSFIKHSKPFRDEHILMLDLFAESRPKSEGRNSPLSKFDYLYGMLNSFGGRMGLHSNLDMLPKMIKASSKNSNFKGIALTAESNTSDPAAIDMFFSTVWENIDDPSQWLKDFALRRYGKESENISRAMDILLKTAYSDKFYNLGEGAPENLLCGRPEGRYDKVSSWGNTKFGYSTKDFEEAAKLFLADYDKFKQNECYIYDAINILRQVLSNQIYSIILSMEDEYKKKDYFAFIENGNKLMSLADKLDKLLLNSTDFSLGTYLAKVRNYSDKLDDFTKEIYMIGAKALITTWYSRPAANPGGLHDYSNRQWGDLISQFYKPRWQRFIDSVKLEMDGKEPEKIDWFKMEWDWVLKDTPCSTKVREDNLKALSKSILS